MKKARRKCNRYYRIHAEEKTAHVEYQLAAYEQSDSCLKHELKTCRHIARTYCMGVLEIRTTEKREAMESELRTCSRLPQVQASSSDHVEIHQIDPKTLLNPADGGGEVYAGRGCFGIDRSQVHCGINVAAK